MPVESVLPLVIGISLVSLGIAWLLAREVLAADTGKPEMRAISDAIREGAQKAGCSFWDTYAVMGGDGSITAWGAEASPRAAKDGVHLTPRGYRTLGESLATHLLKGLPE